MSESSLAKPRYEVAAVRKALAILCSFTNDRPALTLSDLGRMLKMPKSTAFNLLGTLQRFDFVSQDAATKQYRLGRKVFELGALFSGRSRLLTCALPHLQRLRESTKETVKLGVLADAGALVMAAIESPLILHTRGDEGRLAPLHCTGVGKALLALLPEDEWRGLIARAGLALFTPRTITSLAQLERDVNETRSRGYTVDYEEHEEGVRCVGAPVRDATGRERVVISVSGPASRFTTERIPGLATQLVETAKAISAAMGTGDGGATPAGTAKLKPAIFDPPHS